MASNSIKSYKLGNWEMAKKSSWPVPSNQEQDHTKSSECITREPWQNATSVIISEAENNDEAIVPKSIF